MGGWDLVELWLSWLPVAGTGTLYAAIKQGVKCPIVHAKWEQVCPIPAGDLSRNRTVGLRIGKGESMQEIMKSMNAVAEGVLTSKCFTHSPCPVIPAAHHAFHDVLSAPLVAQQPAQGDIGDRSGNSVVHGRLERLARRTRWSRRTVAESP
jgi:NAD-dependent glycerol-3-phosphate dehydrogenase C-terminus